MSIDDSNFNLYSKYVFLRCSLPGTRLPQARISEVLAVLSLTWTGEALCRIGREKWQGGYPIFYGKKHGKHGKENGLLKLLNQSIETAAKQVVASLEADIQYISVWNHPCEHKENHLPQVVAFSYFGRFQSLNFGGSKERECAAWFGWSQILTFLW